MSKQIQNKTKSKNLLDIIYFMSSALIIALILCTDIWYLKSGSMAPAYPAGSVIITSPLVSPDIGSVCAYEHNGMTVVHRIISRSENGFITKGDANNCSDPSPVSENDIKGTMLIGIPLSFNFNS